MRPIRSLAVVVLCCAAAEPLAAQEGKPLLIEGKLAKDDPRDAVRQQSGHKVHEVKLEAGKCYQIDLSSKEFDPFLRLEDDQKKQLGFNDDIDYPAKILDARLCFAPLRTGAYRVVVTSYAADQTGAYRLQVQALAAGGKPVIEPRRLGKESRLANGRRYEVLPLVLATGEAQVVEAAGKEFAPRLLLVDDKGKLVRDGVVQEQGKGVARLTVAAVHAVRYGVLVTTGEEGESGAYAWRVATYRSPSSAVAGKGKVDRAAVVAAYEQAENLKKQGRFTEAVPVYERVVQAAQDAFGPDHLDTAAGMNNLAELYREQGQYGKAEPLYERSLAIFETKLGKDHPDVATSLNNLALLYQAQSQYARAQPLYLRSLAISESKLGKDHPSVATTLNGLATLYEAQAQYGKAEPLYLRSLGIRESKLGKDHPSVATALNNLAGLYYRAHRQYARAEALYLRSLAIWESKLGKDHPDVARSLSNLADLYQVQGQYARAEVLYLRSLAIRESKLGKDHPSVVTALNNLAGLYVARGQYARAEPLLQRSLAIAESKLGKDHAKVATSLSTLAGLYWGQRQYARAEPLLLRSLAISESKLGKDHPHVATSLNNLATLYLEQGQYGNAEALLLRSLAIYEGKLGKDHPDVAASLSNLALLYGVQGQYGKAEPLYLGSLAIWESKLGKDHPSVATTLNNLAGLYGAQEKWPQAAEALDRARRGLRRQLSHELASLPERDQVTFLRTEAVADFHMALSMAWLLRDQEGVRRPSAAWLVNGQALAHEALAEQILLQRDSAAQPWAPLAAELHEARRQLAALAVQTPPVENLAAHRQLLAELGEREEDLARRVARHSGHGTRAAAWLELDELRKALPADTTLVALARFAVCPFKAKGKERRWGPARYAAWVIDARDVQVVDLGEAAVIEKDVQALGRELSARRAVQRIKQEGEPDAEKMLRRHLDAVAKRVLHPLLPHLGKKQRWLVCPDGALWLVPWNALTLPDGKYVVEKHTVSHLVSGRDLIPSDYKVKPSAPVVLADPDFDLAPGQKGGGKPVPGEDDAAATRSVPLGAVHFGRLPGTAAEAKVIAPKLRAYAGEAPKVHTGAEATEAAFKALKGPKVLVLATHGFFLPDVERKPDDDVLRQRPKRPARPEENPLLRSGLALAGANQRDKAAERGVDDGILTALEILQTDLRGTELVVLSACETGLGEVRNGEGVAGLRQAFQLAGAQSVLATLWQIPDRQTAQLMGKFFDHLAAGRGRADALRLAQLEMIRTRRQREGAAHPFYWAAFTLTGNWR